MGVITTDTEEVEKSIVFYFKACSTQNWKNLKEMADFLETQYFPKLNLNQVKYLSSPITHLELKGFIKYLPMGENKDLKTTKKMVLAQNFTKPSIKN